MFTHSVNLSPVQTECLFDRKIKNIVINNVHSVVVTS